MLNFDRSVVKHGTQNIQNDCHQWLSGSFRVHRIRFRPRLCPGPLWGSLQRSPNPLAGLTGPTSKGEERGERGERERKGERRGTGRTAHFRSSWIRTCNVPRYCAIKSFAGDYNRSLLQVSFRSNFRISGDAINDAEVTWQYLSETIVSRNFSRITCKTFRVNIYAAVQKLQQCNYAVGRIYPPPPSCRCKSSNC